TGARLPARTPPRNESGPLPTPPRQAAAAYVRSGPSAPSPPQNSHMMGHDPVRRPPQGLAVKPPLQPQTLKDVIGFARSHLRQEPQPLLRKRQWKIFPALGGRNRR